jgi:hypothetical protein
MTLQRLKVDEGYSGGWALPASATHQQHSGCTVLRVFAKGGYHDGLRLRSDAT